MLVSGKYRIKGCGKLGIAVVQEQAHHSLLILQLPYELTRLLRHPGSGFGAWVQPEEMNAASADLKKEERLHGFQAHRFHRKEITGERLMVVLAQEGSPGTALPSAHWCCRNMLAFVHVSNGGATNLIA